MGLKNKSLEAQQVVAGVSLEDMVAIELYGEILSAVLRSSGCNFQNQCSSCGASGLFLPPLKVMYGFFLAVVDGAMLMVSCMGGALMCQT